MTSTGTIARLPPCTSADRYAASFQPPYVSNTNTIANPNNPGAGAAAENAVNVCGVAGDVMKPASAITSKPPTSTIVNQFCVHADVRKPTMLMIVSAAT